METAEGIGSSGGLEVSRRSHLDARSAENSSAALSFARLKAHPYDKERLSYRGDSLVSGTPSAFCSFLVGLLQSQVRGD